VRKTLDATLSALLARGVPGSTDGCARDWYDATRAAIASGTHRPFADGCCPSGQLPHAAPE